MTDPAMLDKSVLDWDDPEPYRPGTTLHSKTRCLKRCAPGTRVYHSSAFRHVYKPIPSAKERERARTSTGGPSPALKRKVAILQGLGIPFNPRTWGREKQEAMEALKALYPNGLDTVHDGPPPSPKKGQVVRGRLTIKSVAPGLWNVKTLTAKTPKEA